MQLVHPQEQLLNMSHIGIVDSLFCAGTWYLTPQFNNFASNRDYIQPRMPNFFSFFQINYICSKNKSKILSEF